MPCTDLRDPAGPFNPNLFEGWQEEPDERGDAWAYDLCLKRIDAP